MKYLKNVPVDKAFILGETRIRSLNGLVKELYNMSDGSYSHYASRDHNYFADWVQYVVKHKKLAGKLRETSDRKDAITALEKEIEELKKPEPKNKKPKKEVEVEEPLDSFVVSDPKAKKKPEEKKEVNKETEKEEQETYDEKEMMRSIARDEREIKEFLWKHFAWDMAKEFMYGLAIGILVGFVLSKIFIGN